MNPLFTSYNTEYDGARWTGAPGGPVWNRNVELTFTSHTHRLGAMRASFVSGSELVTV
jgi:hypothetical protein